VTVVTPRQCRCHKETIEQQHLAATEIRNKMVRPWLKDENGNKKQLGGPKKQLAAAQTRKPNPNGKPHGVMPKERRGHGWTAKK
jgi:hypothetical protein